MSRKIEFTDKQKEQLEGLVSEITALQKLVVFLASIIDEKNELLWKRVKEFFPNATSFGHPKDKKWFIREED